MTKRKFLYPKPLLEELCECGDYQSDHENGTGRCRYGGHNIPSWYPENRCERFRGTGRMELNRFPVNEVPEGR